MYSSERISTSKDKTYYFPSSILFLILSLSWSDVEGQRGSSVLWDRYTAGVCLDRTHILQYLLPRVLAGNIRYL